jgi:hypothetical protein
LTPTELRLPRGPRVNRFAEAGGKLRALGYQPQGSFTAVQAALYDALVNSGVEPQRARYLAQRVSSNGTSGLSAAESASVKLALELLVGNQVGIGGGETSGALPIGGLVALGNAFAHPSQLPLVELFSGGPKPPRIAGGRPAPPIPRQYERPDFANELDQGIRAIPQAVRFGVGLGKGQAFTAPGRGADGMPQAGMTSQGVPILDQVTDCPTCGGGGPQATPSPSGPLLLPPQPSGDFNPEGGPGPQPGSNPLEFVNGTGDDSGNDLVITHNNIPMYPGFNPQGGNSPQTMPVFTNQPGGDNLDWINQLQHQLGQEIQVEQQQLDQQQQQQQQQQQLRGQLQQIAQEVQYLQKLEYDRPDSRNIPQELQRKQELQQTLELLKPIAAQTYPQPQQPGQQPGQRPGNQQQTYPQPAPELKPEPQQGQPNGGQRGFRPQTTPQATPTQFCVGCQSQEDAIMFLNGEQAACSVIPGTTQPIGGM